MQKNQRQNVVSLWLAWHFYEMPEFLLGVWKNYILFTLNYFSLLFLLKTFFSPWHKYRWMYPKGFHVGEFLNTLISNTFSRIIGAMIRVALIIIGIICQIFVVLAGALVILLWVLIPFIIVAGFLFVFIY